MEEAKTFEPMHLELSEEAKIAKKFAEYCKERGLSNHDIGLISLVLTVADRTVDEEEDFWFDEDACLDILDSLWLMGEDVLTVFTTFAAFMLEFKNKYDICNDDFDKTHRQILELVDYIAVVEKLREEA